MAHFEQADSPWESGSARASSMRLTRRAHSARLPSGMDSRINVFDALGIEVGDCHVIRTAGGRVQDAIRSLVISQTQIGLNEVMLVSRYPPRKILLKRR